MTAERPILFSGPMVRAILSGKKTQTRRVDRGALACPCGVPGDRLWVRENWASGYAMGCSGTLFAADGSFVQGKRGHEKGPHYNADDLPPGMLWRPSIHMPRWASRITLEITLVRVERLQSISDDDACAEGTPCEFCGRTYDGLSEEDCACFHSKAARSSFSVLWDSINGKRPGCSWADNPWVWVISFERIESEASVRSG